MAQQMPQLQKKLLKKDNAILVKCQECGKKFKTMSMVPTCPKCGGSDIDLAEMKSLSSMVKEAEREEYYHIKKDGDTWNVVHSVHQSPQLGGQVLMNEQVPKKVCPNCGKTSLARPGIDDPYKCAYCGTKLNKGGFPNADAAKKWVLSKWPNDASKIRMTEDGTDANKYIASIRNPKKKAYAQAYLKYKSGETSEEPDHNKFGLGYMGAQAVRIQLGAK